MSSMRLFDTGRWPALVDAATVAANIRSITEAGPDFEAHFYETVPSTDLYACQGDVVELTTEAPYIDEEGNAATAGEFDYWLIIGNTCDMQREDETRSLVAPLVGIKKEVTPDELDTLRKYKYCKKFYVPPWKHDLQPQHHFADFMQLATIHRAAFRADCARVVARLRFPAWALLHVCIVRFLARDDGRFD